MAATLKLETVLTIEQGEDEQKRIVALQEAINSGQGWALQGSFGRAMMDAIDAGACLLGREGCRDYWGNYIPSRDEVKAGTRGSFEFVAARYGREHAEFIREV